MQLLLEIEQRDGILRPEVAKRLRRPCITPNNLTPKTNEGNQSEKYQREIDEFRFVFFAGKDFSNQNSECCYSEQ